jgi:hypothetical protein
MPGAGGTRRVAAEKNRSRSFGYAEKRFAQDDTKLSQRGWLAGPYFIFGIFVVFAAVGDESPNYESSPDTKLLSFPSCLLRELLAERERVAEHGIPAL